MTGTHQRKFGRSDLMVTDMGFDAVPTGNFQRPISEEEADAMVHHTANAVWILGGSGHDHGDWMKMGGGQHRFPQHCRMAPTGWSAQCCFDPLAVIRIEKHRLVEIEGKLHGAARKYLGIGPQPRHGLFAAKVDDRKRISTRWLHNFYGAGYLDDILRKPVGAIWIGDRLRADAEYHLFALISGK